MIFTPQLQSIQRFIGQIVLGSIDGCATAEYSLAITRIETIMFMANRSFLKIDFHPL